MPTTFSRLDPWLTLEDDVVTSSAIEDSVVVLRSYYKLHQFVGVVSSGVRPPEAQITEAILYYANKKNIKELFPEFVEGLTSHWAADYKIPAPVEVHTEFHLEKIYWWQRTWSKLLGLGILINPALDAICLEDSLRDNGSNRRGAVIKQTTHVSGLAYDIKGGSDLMKNYHIVQEASMDKASKIKSVTLEKNNNCVHINLVA